MTEPPWNRIAPDDEDPPSSSPSVSGSGPTRSANCTGDRGVVYSGWNWLTPNIWAQFWGLWNAMNLEKVSWPAFAERFQMIFGIWIGDLGACVLGNTGPYITETRWLGLLKYWSNRDNSGPDAKIIAMWRTSFYEGWFVGFLSDLESSQRVRSYQSKWLVRCSSNIPLYTLVYRQEINGTYCLYNSRIGHHQPGQCGIMVDSETEPVWHKIKKNVDRDFWYFLPSSVRNRLQAPTLAQLLHKSKCCG